MSKRKRLVILTVTLIAAALCVVLFPLWQGPSLPAYTLQNQALVQTVVGAGRLQSLSQSSVGSEIIGVVLERRVQEGDSVTPGDVLLVLRSDEWEARLQGAEAALSQLELISRPQAQLAVEQARAHYQQVMRETQRRRELFARQLIARESLEQSEDAESVARVAAEHAALAALALAPGGAEEAMLREQVMAARAMLAKTVIKAVVAGTVLTRQVEPGDLVQPGRVLLEIAGSGVTEILLPLDEKNLAVIALGQTAMCVTDAFPEQPFPALISYIAPSVDVQRGTVEVRLQVADLPASMREGMTVSVNILTGAREQALVVPNDALRTHPDGRVSVLRVAAGKVARTSVRLGLQGLVMTEVVAGLNSGDRVLANGEAELPDGRRVRVTELALPLSAAKPAGAGALSDAFN